MVGLGVTWKDFQRWKLASSNNTKGKTNKKEEAAIVGHLRGWDALLSSGAEPSGGCPSILIGPGLSRCDRRENGSRGLLMRIQRGDQDLDGVICNEGNNTHNKHTHGPACLLSVCGQRKKKPDGNFSS